MITTLNALLVVVLLINLFLLGSSRISALIGAQRAVLARIMVTPPES